MKAMTLTQFGLGHVELVETDKPVPGALDVLVKVLACGVSELLDVDREYRKKAAAGELQQIAPRRFNPSGEAWLPILHTRRGPRRYTALFSNTARAHRTGNARDWVVLYGDNGSGEHRHTVITASYGPLRGRRVVAGREDECRAVYNPVPARTKPHGPSRRVATAHDLLSAFDNTNQPGG